MIVRVAAINIAARFALLSDGRSLPITTLIDHVGDETDDAGQAVYFICGDGRDWFSESVADHQGATVR